jgi:hypothetical protein
MTRKLDKITANLPCASKVIYDLKYSCEELLGDVDDLREWSDLDGVRKTWALIPYGTAGIVDPVRSKKLLDKRPLLKAFFSEFPGQILHAVYSYLAADSCIPCHRDTFKNNGEKRPKFTVFNSAYRFHIPLISNDQAFYYSKGLFYQMAAGQLWMINNHEIHGVINNHTSKGRYHLIFDVLADHSTLELLKAADTTLGVENKPFQQRLDNIKGKTSQ